MTQEPDESRPERDEPPGPQDQAIAPSTMYRMAGVGMELVIGVVLFGGLGWWLDSKWQTRPWLMILGGGLGFSAGLWRLIKIARRSFHD